VEHSTGRRRAAVARRGALLGRDARLVRGLAGSAQASMFSELDWVHVQLLAGLVDRFFARPSSALFRAISGTEADWGATPRDRRRLRLTIEEPVPERDAHDEADREPQRRRIVDPRLKHAADVEPPSQAAPGSHGGMTARSDQEREK